MKIVLITDTHWGVRNDHQAVLSHFEKFYDNVFFPYLDEHKIKTVIHLGDLVDRRKYINYHTAARMRSKFLDQLVGPRMQVYILAGNHDTYYKDTNRVNALNELNLDRKTFHIIDQEPFDARIDVHNVLLVPWINDTNRAKTMEMLKTTDAQYVFGHFEINGAEMFKGMFSDHGMDRDDFKRFKRVFSGHFHHKSTINNIEYLGAPYQMTWSDADCARGFHVFDLEKNHLEFIANPYKLFQRIIYNDAGCKNIEELMNMHDFSMYNGSFVKVVVFNKTNPYWFDLFMEKLESVEPIDLKIIEESLMVEFSDEEIGQAVDDPLTILRNHCKSEKHSDLVEKKLVELYQQAIASTI